MRVCSINILPINEIWYHYRNDKNENDQENLVLIAVPWVEFRGRNRVVIKFHVAKEVHIIVLPINFCYCLHCSINILSCRVNVIFEDQNPVGKRQTRSQCVLISDQMRLLERDFRVITNAFEYLCSMMRWLGFNYIQILRVFWRDRVRLIEGVDENEGNERNVFGAKSIQKPGNKLDHNILRRTHCSCNWYTKGERRIFDIIQANETACQWRERLDADLHEFVQKLVALPGPLCDRSLDFFYWRVPKQYIKLYCRIKTEFMAGLKVEIQKIE